MVSEIYVEWGKITFCGNTFKDAKVWSTKTSGEGASEWDWNEDNTRHQSGITIEAVETLLKHKPNIIVLTKGYDEKLNVYPELVEWISKRGMKVMVMNTPNAVAMFNYLITQGENVAGLFHSTC